MNDLLSGECIPKEWNESRVVLVHKGGSKKDVINYRPISVINAICKLFIMIIKDSINGWVEESGMLCDVQVFFRRGRRTEDNLFMLEKMIEMAKVRKECLFVSFIDIEKAYDRVNRKKLVEVMRGYGVQEKLVNVIERIYDRGMVKIELEGIMLGWCRIDSGVRQGCPLSSLLFVVLCLPTPLTLVCGGGGVQSSRCWSTRQHIPPSGQHIPPSGQHNPPSGQHIPPSGQHIPPSGQKLITPGVTACCVCRCS